MGDNPTKAVLQYEKPSGPHGKIECMFNPNKLSFVRTNGWTARTTGEGLDAPPQRFTGEESGTFDIELIFDTTDKGKSVSEKTNKVVDLMNIGKYLGEERPPLVRLVWGKHISSFWSVINQATVTYTYFGADGMPLRANVDLELGQAFGVGKEWSKQNPTSGTPDPHGRHQVQLGETLDRLAARYYGDSNRWRDIAAANNISDPLALRPGRVLTIPDQ